MFIRRINRLFASHGRKMFLIITIFIIIAFVGLFTPGFTSILSPFFKSERDVVAVVFDDSVTLEQMKEQVHYLMISMALRWKIPSLRHSGLQDAARKEAFNVMGKLKAADKMGICVSNKDIAKYIRGLEVFQTDKKFDFKKFNDWDAKTLRPAGLDKTDLDEAIRQQLILESLYNEITDTVIVTPDEVKDYFQAEKENIKIKVARFNADKMLDKVKVNDKEVESFYNLHQKEYQTDPEFKAEIIQFNYKDYEKKARPEIKEEQIVEYFDSKDDDFIKKEKTRLARNVKKKVDSLIKYEKKKKTYPGSISYWKVQNYLKKNKSGTEDENGDISKDVKEKITQKLLDEKTLKEAEKEAQTFAVEVYKLVNETEKDAIKIFQKLSKTKHNKSTISTGWFKTDDETLKDIGKEPELIKAISGIYQQPPISNSIKGDKGVYVAYLSGKKPSRQSKFDEVKEQIVKDLKQEKAINNAREKARNAALKLSEALAKGKKLDEIKDKPEFEDIPAYTGKYVPAADGRLLSRLAAKTRAHEISKTENAKDGALFVYVENKKSPTEDDFFKEQDTIEKRYQQMKQFAAWQAFNEWVTVNTKVHGRN